MTEVPNILYAKASAYTAGTNSQPAKTAVTSSLAQDVLSPNPQVRVQALIAIFGSNNPEKTFIVLRALKDPFAKVRFFALKLLAGTKNDDFLPVFIDALFDPDKANADFAESTLFSFGNKAFSSFKDLLLEEKTPKYVKLRIIALFEKLGGDYSEAFLALFKTAEIDIKVRLLQVSAKLNKTEKAQLINLGLSDADPTIRNEAKKLIAGLDGTKELVQIYMAYCTDAEVGLAVRSALLAKDPREVPSLIYYLDIVLSSNISDDAKLVVSVDLMRVLFRLKAPDSFFSDRVSSKYKFIQIEALRLLGFRKTPDLHAKLYYFATKADADPQVRTYSINALGANNDQNDLPTFIALLADHDEAVVAAAKAILRKFGDAALPQLSKAAASDPNPEIKEKAGRFFSELAGVKEK